MEITEIGTGSDAALICTTDQTDCCNTAAGSNRGDWLNPDGSMIVGAAAGGDFYVTRSLQQVRLNRRNNALRPLGQYCCAVDTRADPDATICKFE